MNARDHERYALLQAGLDGRATSEQTERINQLLRTDPQTIDLYLELADTHSCLAVDEQLWSDDRASKSPATDIRSTTLAWRSIAASATGLVIGLLSASAVWAYVAPLPGKGIILLQEGFETSSAPLTAGIPIEVERWSGDDSEIVKKEQGVKPEGGDKMLRLLRADHEGKENAAGYVANVYRLIDLRPNRLALEDSRTVVQFSAGFNACAFPTAESYRCIVSLHALDAEAVEQGVLREREVLNAEALSMTTSSRLMLDRDPVTWQRQTAELRLPPNTEFLLLHVGLAHGKKSQRRVDFDGHYLDEIRLTLTRRASVP